MSALPPKADIGAFTGTSLWGVDDWNVEDFFSLSWMTTRPERFRVKAVECHVAAQKTQDLATREAYLELGRCWRELADEIERFEHSWLDRGGI